MNLQTYYKPIPVRLAQFLLFLNVVVGLIAGSSLVTNQPQIAAYLSLGAGILNTAVQVFVGQNLTHEHEKVSADSTLSNRRDLVQEKGTRPKARRTKGGAE